MRELRKDATFLDAEREKVGTLSGLRVWGLEFAGGDVGAAQECHLTSPSWTPSARGWGFQGVRVLVTGFAWRIWQHPPEPLPNGTLHGHFYH